jgi:hypothetical protein
VLFYKVLSVAPPGHKALVKLMNHEVSTLTMLGGNDIEHALETFVGNGESTRQLQKAIEKGLIKTQTRKNSSV